MGAVYFAASKTGVRESILQKLDPIDVLALGVGIGCDNGHTDFLVKKNTPLPVKVKKTYKTSRDQQDAALIVVLQGDSSLNDNNKLLGKFTVTGIPVKPRGMVIFEIIFDVDANGILVVSAAVCDTNITTSLTINSLRVSYYTLKLGKFD